MRLDAAMKWYGGAALSAVLVLVAGWFLLVSPTQTNASDISAQAQDQVTANQETQAKIDALKAQYKNLPTLQKELASVQTHMPQTPQMPALLRSLSAAAAKDGVALLSVSPANPAPLGSTGASADLAATGQVNVIPVSMTVQSDFANLKLFLASLEMMPRSVLVTGVNIVRFGDGSGSISTSVNKGSLSATITARVFSANPGIAAAPTTPVTTTGTAGEPAAAS